MSLRLRILLGSCLLALIPILVLGIGVRHEVTARLSGQYTENVEAMAAYLETEFTEESSELEVKLTALAAEIREDNRFRLALLDEAGGADEAPYLRDFAQRAMGLMGLAVLQVQDARGRILSSGHFRNEYGREELQVLRALAAAPQGTGLLNARTPEGTLLGLARVDSLRMGATRLYLVAGIPIERRFLRGLAPRGSVTLVHPGGVRSSDNTLAARMDSVLAAGGPWRDALPTTAYRVLTHPVPMVVASGEDAKLVQAQFVVSYPLDALTRTTRNLTLWLLVAGGVVAAGALGFAIWLSFRLSRPIAELARATTTIDLDRLETRLPAGRSDEVGTLSRFLVDMTRRLRASASRLQQAERRATRGELARQINHDIRNGLTPIRNVLRHVSSVAEESPDQLPAVYAERRATLESSVEYLETLAANYARLSPRMVREATDVNGVIREAVHEDDGARVQLRLESRLPRAMVDPVSLRRIVENLVRNGIESLEGGGTVTVTTESAEDTVRVTVRDTGVGIPEEEQDRVFQDFFSTKESGSGLGLSIVRRLVSDNHGRLTLTSTTGAGTSVSFTLPRATGAAASPGKEPS